MKNNVSTVRQLIYSCLLKYQKNQKNIFISDLVDTYLNSNRFAIPADNALFFNIVYGVIKNRTLLDHYITTVSGQPLDRITDRVLELLRMAFFQLIFLDRIPEYACLNETVELAKQQCNKKTAGFVNAVLRKYLKNKGMVKESDLKIKYSYPEWIIEYFLKKFGQEKTISILEYFSKIPENYLRPSGQRKDSFYIQDKHSLKAVDMLDPQKDELILDCCAAPGGKSIYIADKTGQPSNITAVDSSANRLKRMQENLERLGYQDINVVCCDLTKDVPLKGKFDKILVDAPCSNLGVMGRRIDVKWRLKKTDIIKLAKLQQNILECVYPFIKKGSTLVYSTCTITSEENMDNIRRFLQDKPGLKLVEETLDLPSDENGDGGYVAVIKKGIMPVLY